MADAHYIAANLRSQDMAEMRAMGIQPRDGVVASFRNADWCEVAVQRGRPAAIFGVCPSASPGRGLPWLLGTHSMGALGSPFIRGCKPVLSRMLDRYPALVNVTHRDNTVARRWLAWLGFRFYTAAPPVNGEFVGFALAKNGYEHLAAEWMTQRGLVSTGVANEQAVRAYQRMGDTLTPHNLDDHVHRT